MIPGQVITIGDTEVSFSIVAGTDAAPDPGARTRRRPHVQSVAARRGAVLGRSTVSVPEVPSGGGADRPFPLAMIAAPVLLGVAMFAFTGRPVLLLSSP